MKLLSLTVLTLTLLLISCGDRSDAPDVAVSEVASPEKSADQAAPIAPDNDPRWRTLHVADDCELRVADNPAAVALELPWKACADGPAGCREMSFTKGDSFTGRSMSLHGLSHGGEVTLEVSTSEPGPLMRYLLAPLDDTPFFALENPPGGSCSIGGIGLSDDGAVVEIAYDNHKGYASRAYLRGPLRQDPVWSQIVARILRTEFPDLISEAVISVGGRVVVAASGGPVRWFDPASKRWKKIPGTKKGWPSNFSGHGDTVVFLISSIPEQLMAARLGDPARELRHIPKGSGASPLAIDGTQAVWLEGRGRDKNNYYERIELWTGEISNKPAIVGARVVAQLSLETMSRPSLGGGVAAWNMYDLKNNRSTELAVVRLSDGKVRHLAPPPDLMFEGILWLTAKEIAVRIGPARNTIGPPTIRRFPIDALPLLPALNSAK